MRKPRSPLPRGHAPKSGRNASIAALVALASLAWTIGAGKAANPDHGTVGLLAPEVAWEGQIHSASRAFFGPDHCPPERDPNGMLCDHFWLTVDVDPSHWTSFVGGVEITIEFRPAAAEDLNLHVFREGALVASSVTRSGTSMEQVLVRNASGLYEIRVTPEVRTSHTVVPDRSFRGRARLVSKKHQDSTTPNVAYRGVRIEGSNPDDEPRTRSEPYAGEALVLQAVDVGRNAAEPTIGIDATGHAYFLALATDATAAPPPGTARSILLRSKD